MEQKNTSMQPDARIYVAGHRGLVGSAIWWRLQAAGLNNLLPEVTNGNIIGPHSGDFVYNGDNVLFEYSNGGFQLIKENPIARFEGGAKYLSFTEAMQLFARGEIVWTGSISDWPGRGVTGCDLSAGQ